MTKLRLRAGKELGTALQLMDGSRAGKGVCLTKAQEETGFKRTRRPSYTTRAGRGFGAFRYES